MNPNRLSRLIDVLRSSSLDGLVFNPGPSLTYLTGLHFHLMERPVVLLLTSQSNPVIVLPELEMGKLSTVEPPIQGFAYQDNPATWKAAFRQACDFLKLDGKTIGLEPTRLRVLELNYLQAAAPQARFVSAEAELEKLRLFKDEQEIAAMQRAVDIAQQAFTETLPFIRPGVSEKEIAAELTIRLLRAGSEPEFPFQPLVASGPNSANPHALPGERKLVKGDLLIIDWGATYQGYCSDLTRTLAIGNIDPELEQIHRLVLAANTAGRAACQPGPSAGSVDVATRAVITVGGYGAYFTHRTGHGLGMEAHEAPYIYAENEEPLAPGMSFTIEPGIYLPGKGGVRIEDNVVITPDGVNCLSSLLRELIVIS